MTRENLRISMLSSFYIAFVLHGLQRMSGLFIIEFLKIKNITQQAAAIPFIYSWAVAKIVASFSDFLIDNKFSELVILCGAFLCAMGAALCILDTDITAITVFWGFIFGSGYGLASPYLARSSANRDSSSVSLIMEVPLCFGITILPFLLNALILQYGLQGSFMVCSGIVLQYVPLALAAAYNIEIRIPKIKWRVRRKFSQYSISKHEGEKTISITNFTNSLEPDFVLKIEQCDDYYKIKKDDPAIFPKEVFFAGRKRSNTRSGDLQDLQINTKILHKHITHPQTVLQGEKCEHFLHNSETSVSNTDVVDVQIECEGFKNLSVLNSEIPHNISMEDKNILASSKHCYNFKCKKLKNISLNEIKETEDEKEDSEDLCSGNDVLKEQIKLADTHLENAKLIVTNSRKDVNNDQISKIAETEKRISVTSQHAKPTPQTFHKKLNKETPVLSTQALQSTVIFTIPLDIKVHVEEYTFTVDSKGGSKSFDSNYLGNMTSNEESRHIGENKYFNSANKNVSKDILRNLNNKSSTPNVQYVSHDHKLKNEIPFEMNKKSMDSNINKNEYKFKFIHFFNFFNKITSPICLAIIIIAVIFETTLITLLTNIGDIENYSDRTFNDFKWILVAFGIGGLFGKFCYFKKSWAISKKSHTIGVLLFLLTAISIAGVLYSPNLKWSAGFYGILGALEVGISSILSTFILDYTHKDVHHMISSMKNFLSGATIICLPSVLGFLSDEMGDYEFLLELFSYLSVLCAFLVYFLPHLSNISNKSSTLSFKGNINS